jgi:hypothetical protein
MELPITKPAELTLFFTGADNLDHSDPSAGNPRPFCYSSGMTPRPKEIFASGLCPLGIPPEQALLSGSPPANLRGGDLLWRNPARHVVSHGNHGGEDSLRIFRFDSGNC